MNPPKLFNLAETLTCEALISDTSLSKQALGQCLGVSRPSIQRYDEIAYWEISDYRESYPLLPKDQWFAKRTKYDRTVPLSQYQIYVISMIQTAFKYLRKEALIREYIQQNSYLFTKSRYENRLRQIAKSAKQQTA